MSNKEWKGTDGVFKISEKGDSTQINHIHASLIPSFECYQDCKAGWKEQVTQSPVSDLNGGFGSPP